MSVLTVYPEAGSKYPMDACTQRNGVNETFGTIIAGAGTFTTITADAAVLVGLYSTTTTDQYSIIARCMFCFDTSILGPNAVISSAVFSIFGKSGNSSALGTTSLEVVAATPASYSAIQNSDHNTFGSTSFGSIALASWSAVAYNDITLNATGISYINKTGTTVLGCMLTWDMNASFTGTWASNTNTHFEGYQCDQAGRANDPKLVITFQTPHKVASINKLRPRIFSPGLAR